MESHDISRKLSTKSVSKDRQSNELNKSYNSSIHSDPSSVQRRTSKESAAPATQSQALADIQNVFNESQKIAYTGLCYVISYKYKMSRLLAHKKALSAFDKWFIELMEKIFVYLDLINDERRMIENLAMHGVDPKDLATSLIRDAQNAAQKFQQQELQRIQAEQDALDAGLPLPDSTISQLDSPLDIRFTILSHLFLLGIADGFYDARSRVLLKTVAKYLEIPFEDIVRLESNIADQLRIYEDSEEFKQNELVIGERNRLDGRNRLLFAGLATLVCKIAGGAVIGLTAGLAAPFIGAGIGAALTTFGVTGAAGVTTFMAGAGGLAIITTGGVLTGGGMSGVKMMKRTRGIEQFEFLGIEEAVKLIQQHREERKQQRNKRLQKEAQEASSQKIQEESSSNRKKPLNSKKTEAWALSLKDIKHSGAHTSDDLPSLSQTKTGEITSSSSFPNLKLESDAFKEDFKEQDDAIQEDEEDEESEAHEIASSAIYSIPQEEDLSPFSCSRQTNVLITIAGWVVHGEDDHSLPFSVLERHIYGDQYTLIWETEVLKDLGTALKILVGEITSFIVQQGIQVLLLPALMAALTGPMWMLKLSYLVDNPWGNALTKAEKAGRVLADTLKGQVQGNRPVTLVGYSLGARVIYHCLLELASQNIFGIIEEVYLFGCPVMANKQDWQKVSSIVAGRIVNGYCSNDMMLGVLYRASTALWSDVAGLTPIMDVNGIENIELKDVIQGHLEYRYNLPLILQKCGFRVTSDYFEDEEDEEEQDRIEAEQEKSKINEEKLRAKEAKLKQRQEEVQAKIIEKQRQAEEKRQEVLRKKSSQKFNIDTKTRFSWFGSSKTTAEVSASSPAIEVLNSATEDLWQPKELKTTLPPLIIKDSVVNTQSSSSHIPSHKEDYDVSLGEAGLNSLISFDSPQPLEDSFDNFVQQLGTRGNIGAGDLADRRTEFEYLSDTEDDKTASLEKQTQKLRIETLEFSAPSPTYSSSRRRTKSAGIPQDMTSSYGQENVRSATNSPQPYIPNTSPNPWTHHHE